MGCRLGDDQARALSAALVHRFVSSGRHPPRRRNPDGGGASTTYPDHLSVPSLHPPRLHPPAGLPRLRRSRKPSPGCARSLLRRYRGFGDRLRPRERRRRPLRLPRDVWRRSGLGRLRRRRVARSLPDPGRQPAALGRNPPPSDQPALPEPGSEARLRPSVHRCHRSLRSRGRGLRHGGCRRRRRWGRQCRSVRHQRRPELPASSEGSAVPGAIGSRWRRRCPLGHGNGLRRRRPRRRPRPPRRQLRPFRRRAHPRLPAGLDPHLLRPGPLSGNPGHPLPQRRWYGETAIQGRNPSGGPQRRRTRTRADLGRHRPRRRHGLVRGQRRRGQLPLSERHRERRSPPRDGDGPGMGSAVQRRWPRRGRHGRGLRRRGRGRLAGPGGGQLLTRDQHPLPPWRPGGLGLHGRDPAPRTGFAQLPAPRLRRRLVRPRRRRRPRPGGGQRSRPRPTASPTSTAACPMPNPTSCWSTTAADASAKIRPGLPGSRLS